MSKQNSNVLKESPLFSKKYKELVSNTNQNGKRKVVVVILWGSDNLQSLCIANISQGQGRGTKILIYLLFQPNN